MKPTLEFIADAIEKMSEAELKKYLPAYVDLDDEQTSPKWVANMFYQNIIDGDKEDAIDSLGIMFLVAIGAIE